MKIKDELVRKAIDKIEFSKPHSIPGDSLEFRSGYIKALVELGLLDGLSAARLLGKIQNMDGWEIEEEEYFYVEKWGEGDIEDALEEAGIDASPENVKVMTEIAREAFEKLDLSNRNDLLWSLASKNCERFSCTPLPSKYLEVLEQQKWNVRGYTYDGRVKIEKFSPAGEDFTMCVSVKDFPDEVMEYYEDFDVDDYIEMWVEAKRNGTREIPSVRRLAIDAEAIDDMLVDLVIALEEVENK